jgi:hypothetical protein
LEKAPELEAKAWFAWLCRRYPGAYEEGQLRTFQRRVQQWRALHGPEVEIYFPQNHVPGRRMATDFTCMNKLEITLGGEPFAHLLCHCVLTSSNWEWATMCYRESLLALKTGLQAALFRLGQVPAEHWTDNSTAATHAVEKGRRFNPEYEELMAYYEMAPHTIQVRCPHENGDVESLHGGLKQRVEHYLLLRGNRDFAGRGDDEELLVKILEEGNRGRQPRLAEEVVVMRTLPSRRLPEDRQVGARVTSWGTIGVAGNSYSVPSRLQGEQVEVRRSEESLEVYYGGVLQERAVRLLGKGGHRINYRHVIGSLVKKPGAFRDYRYRDDLLLSETFKWAYERLCATVSARLADREYLGILAPAARTLESVVEAVLTTLRPAGETPRLARVLQLAPAPQARLPELPAYTVDLAGYDDLIKGQEAVA